MIGGIGVRIVAIGLRKITMKETQNQPLANFVTSAKPSGLAVLAKHNLTSQLSTSSSK